MDEASSQPLPPSDGYRVLARKYRPSTFDDLIGQEPMVRTLSNAFETGRIHQAYMLTGVRGVGKTTTARILARGLNYEPPEGGGGPTIAMPSLGRHCQAIIDSRHIDVMELDAASHNGVSDIRDITDSVRYSPVSARFKVLIMDEVHMVTNQAFNALLKTLEEPPPHVKFIFATTEIRKVPITILSRCQRFDLRRVDAALLVRHLTSICDKEGVSAEPEALAMIARAAEGSVRDSLSLLDQAIAFGAGTVAAEAVRAMLGLADRGRVIDLFAMVVRGDAGAALGELRSQYGQGADPAAVLTELAEFTHFVTRVKVSPHAAADASLTEVERVRGSEMAQGLSLRALSRLWQMLTKGIGEVQAAAKPIIAADMVLIRLCHAADLPTPDELIRQLASGEPPEPGSASPKPSLPSSSSPLSSPGVAPRALVAGNGGGVRQSPATSPAPSSSAQPAQAERALASFEEVVALAGEKRDLPLKLALERFVRLVAFEDGRIDLALAPGAPQPLVNDLSRKLSDWTNRRWLVVLSSKEGAPTLRERAEARQAEVLTGVRADPLVRAVLERFPGAEIVDVRENGPIAADVAALAAPEDGEDEDGFQHEN
jgi:DNA polymerase III subunit gamma/tau